MFETDEKAKRELNLRCKIILDLTKEIVENETPSSNRLFFWACHETWMLKSFPKCLASKKAYNMFFEKYKKDIRECDWFSKEIAECRDASKKRLFMHEHLTTSEDFKRELIYLYKSNKLTLEKIKQLIYQQRVCWITRDEDDKLISKGYRVHRANPLLAYAECGIEIYESEKEDLSNIMIPSIGDACDNPIKVSDCCNSRSSNVQDGSIGLLERIREEFYACFPNFNFHYCMSYVQIWKKSWNNQGKRGIHFELTPSHSRGFSEMSGKEKFVISFKLHNENATRNIMPQIPNSKVYFKKEYSFLNNSVDQSINELLEDIKRIINIDENNIDKAHKNLEYK